jgi:hypothetical protein
MGTLPNQRHELFAQALAAGKTASEAYGQAGYKPDDGHACRLAGIGKVRARVAELQSKAASRAEITLASLLDEAEEARRLAIQMKNPAAAIAAIKEKGVLSGIRVEKRENTNRKVEEMTDDELAAELADVRASLKALGVDETRVAPGEGNDSSSPDPRDPRFTH